MQDDLATINLLEAKCGGLTKAASALGITPFLLHNWKLRGVASHRRLHFLTVFNSIMPRADRLGLEAWLARAPAAYGNNGSTSDGRKSGRKKAAGKAKKRKGPARQARKRVDARARA